LSAGGCFQYFQQIITGDGIIRHKVWNIFDKVADEWVYVKYEFYLNAKNSHRRELKAQALSSRPKENRSKLKPQLRERYRSQGGTTNFCQTPAPSRRDG